MGQSGLTPAAHLPSWDRLYPGITPSFMGQASLLDHTLPCMNVIRFAWDRPVPGKSSFTVPSPFDMMSIRYVAVAYCPSSGSSPLLSKSEPSRPDYFSVIHSSRRTKRSFTPKQSLHPLVQVGLSLFPYLLPAGTATSVWACPRSSSSPTCHSSTRRVLSGSRPPQCRPAT